MWTLLLWMVVAFIIIYTLYGPYMFASFCGAYYMQHNYNLSTDILQHEHIPATISTTSSPGRSPSRKQTRDPFNVDSGTCLKDDIISQNTVLHCVQSPNYPDHYPSSESCRIDVAKFYPGDSLTAIDFATRVGDKLTLRWRYPYKCGNDGNMDVLGDWKYITSSRKRRISSRGYRDFEGLVGGPCNFTCLDFGSTLIIEWKPRDKPNPLSVINATGWKVCYNPREIEGERSNVVDDLACAAPAPVCAPEFYLIYLWTVYIGAGCLFLFSLFVCYCGKTIGACCDVCCLFNRGVVRCCYDVCYNACVRADAVVRRRAHRRNTRIAARNSAYEKVCMLQSPSLC